ncbi:uncharacterized protein LODBEIA_P17140 [Lodderomyces beijingensis]|uniref:Uncharacterized protein n=1 Tax=Lodderomyces beijingensis TaxID=1775926 RepID=A0ABP0ZJV9_9ASCO
MKLATFSSLLLAFLTPAALAETLDQTEIRFLTALVGDYQAHRTDYIRFFATATGIPAALSTLATQVLTYTDDSYTTIQNVDVSALASYATNIPWFTRIAAEAGGAAANTGTGEATRTTTSSSSSAGPLGIPYNTASTSSNRALTTTTEATANSNAAATTVTRQAPVTNGGAGHAAGPLGAALGALAVALL